MILKFVAGTALIVGLAGALSVLVRALDWAVDKWIAFRLARYREREKRPYFPNRTETIEDVSVWLASVGVVYLVLEKYGNPWYSPLVLLWIGPAVVLLRHERQQYQTAGKPGSSP